LLNDVLGGWFWGIRFLFLGNEVGASMKVSRVGPATIAASWGLFSGFFTIGSQVAASVLDKPRRVSAVPRTVTETLAGKALCWAESFERFKIGMGFSGVPKSRMYMGLKFREISSSLRASFVMCWDTPFRTTLREHSSGRLKVWNSVFEPISAL